MKDDQADGDAGTFVRDKMVAHLPDNWRECAANPMMNLRPTSKATPMEQRGAFQISTACGFLVPKKVQCTAVWSVLGWAT